MSSLKAVIFDLDGTLLDSFHLHYSAYETMFGHFGIEMERERFLETYSPNWYRTYEAFGLDEQHWQLANTLWLEAADCYQAACFPNAVEILRQLEKRFKLGIVTSGSKSRVIRDLDRLDLARHFAVVVTGDDVTEPKPAPESLELALEHLSLVPGDAVYVGDALADFEMARAAGVHFIGVPSEFANLMHDHPEYVVHPIDALAEVILSLR